MCNKEYARRYRLKNKKRIQRDMRIRSLMDRLHRYEEKSKMCRKELEELLEAEKNDP